MSTDAVHPDGSQRLRLSLCALEQTMEFARLTGRPGLLSLMSDGRMALHLPSGKVYEVLGDEMDEFQSRGWVEVDDADGSLRLTESGRYWAGRWSRDRAFLRAMGVR